MLFNKNSIYRFICGEFCIKENIPFPHIILLLHTNNVLFYSLNVTNYVVKYNFYRFPGTGKSHLAISLAYLATQKRLKVKLLRVLYRLWYITYFRFPDAEGHFGAITCVNVDIALIRQPPFNHNGHI